MRCLTEPERILFRRFAVFFGGFDIDAAQTIVGSGAVERYQVIDQLTLLVDKSLVVADDSGGRTRYRLLETVRQYALEKLGESGEADTVRARHRDYYTALAALLDAPAGTDYEQRIEQADLEIDNLRAAFGWSRENSDVELALALASSLQPLWQARGRLREGLTWFDTALTDLDAHQPEVSPAVRARALADSATLGLWVASAESPDQAQQALAIAREIDDPALLMRALTACGYIAAYFDAVAAGPYLAEAIGLARDLGDRWRLSQILVAQVVAALTARDPIAARAAAEEGRDIADAIGDRFDARRCRWYLGIAQLYRGDLAGAAAQFAAVADEAEAAHDEIWRVDSLVGLGIALAYQGDTAAARAAADAAVEATAELGGLKAAAAYHVLAFAALAAGDATTAQDATEAAAATHECRAPGNGAAASPLCGGRACGRGSGRGPPLGRRRRIDNDGRVPVGPAERRAPAWRSHKVSQTRLSVTPTTRWRMPPKSKRTCTSPTSWNASALWPARPAVTAKRPASSARQRPSGNVWARCGSRSTTPITKPR